MVLADCPCWHHCAAVDSGQVNNEHSTQSARETIEHSYGKLCELWRLELTGKYLFRLENGVKFVNQQIALMFLLTNLHTCFHGSIVTSEFKALPPTIEEYLQLH